MERDRERMAYEEANAPTPMLAGALGVDSSYTNAKQAMPERTTRGHYSVRERINRTLREAQNTYERAGAAQRAKELIEKHPEVAELLDLLNRF